MPSCISVVNKFGVQFYWRVLLRLIGLSLAESYKYFSNRFQISRDISWEFKRLCYVSHAANFKHHSRFFIKPFEQRCIHSARLIRIYNIAFVFKLVTWVVTWLAMIRVQNFRLYNACLDASFMKADDRMCSNTLRVFFVDHRRSQRVNHLIFCW